jgi:hypothetical protein
VVGAWLIQVEIAFQILLQIRSTGEHSNYIIATRIKAYLMQLVLAPISCFFAAVPVKHSEISLVWNAAKVINYRVGVLFNIL